MNILDWLHHLSKQSLEELGSICHTLDELSGIIEDETATTEFDVVCTVADLFYEKGEYIAALEHNIKDLEEKQHICTCGGDCKDKPRVLCFECAKMKWREVSTSNESWLLNFDNAATCDELNVHGRLYTKCDDFEPREART